MNFNIMHVIKNKKTILIIEDESSLVNIISSKLKEDDFNVVASATVDGGIRDMESNKIDFIWLDHYLLGNKDGIDFVTEVKKREEWKDIPIFVISNTANADKLELYIKLGINKYYVKSDNRIESIINDIKKLLSK
ncbi:MAG: response regulator [Patescibacteria group bacterium]